MSSKKVKTKFVVTILSVNHMMDKVSGCTSYVKWKRGDNSKNKGKTTTVKCGEDGSIVLNETIMVDATLMKNLKTHQFETKNMSFTAYLCEPKIKSDKDKAIIGKLVLDLSKFFDNPEGKMIEYTLNSKALKKKKPKVPTLTIKVVGLPELVSSSKSKKVKDGGTEDSDVDSSMEESGSEISSSRDSFLSSSESEADYLSFSESEMKRNPSAASTPVRQTPSSSLSITSTPGPRGSVVFGGAAAATVSSAVFASISVPSAKDPGKRNAKSPSPASRRSLVAGENPYESYREEKALAGAAKSPRSALDEDDPANPFNDLAKTQNGIVSPRTAAAEKDKKGIIGGTFQKMKDKWRHSSSGTTKKAESSAPLSVEHVAYVKALEASHNVLLASLTINIPRLFVSENEEDFEEVTDLLSLADEVLTDRDIPRSLYIKSIAQIFYVMNCLVFNGLLDMDKLTATMAYSVKRSISKIEQWASMTDSLVTAASLVPLVRDQFEHMISAANVIAIEKTTFTDEFDFTNNTLFPKLNVRQIERLLDKFAPDKFARRPMPQEAKDRLRRTVSAAVPPHKLLLVPPAFSS